MRSLAFVLICLFAIPAQAQDRWISSQLKPPFLGAEACSLVIASSRDHAEVRLLIRNRPGSDARFRSATYPVTLTKQADGYLCSGDFLRSGQTLRFDPGQRTLTLRDNSGSRAIRLYRPRGRSRPAHLETEP